MATTYKKIRDMTAASALDGTELFEAVQSSAPVKVTGAQINTMVGVGASGMSSYTTGWVDGGADWTATSKTVTHNLGKNLWDLQVDVFLANDSAGSACTALRSSHDGTGDKGYSFINVDTNSFLFQTATGGISHINAAGGAALIDTEQRHYKVNVYYFGI